MQKIICLVTFFCYLQFTGFSQNIIPVAVQQYDDRIEVSMSYDGATKTNRPGLAGSDELKYTNQRFYISIKNKTQNKLVLKIVCSSTKSCGITAEYQVSDVNGRGILQAGQTKTSEFEVSLGTLGDKKCDPTKKPDGTYSYIASVGYTLIDINEIKPAASETTEARNKSINTTNSTAQNTAAKSTKGSSSTSSNTSTSSGNVNAKADDDFWETGKQQNAAVKQEQQNSSKTTQKTAAQIAREKQIADEKAVDEIMAKVRKDQAENDQIYKDIDRKFDLQRQGFAAVNAREEAKENVKEISTLANSYKSVDALMADFNQRMAQLNSAVSDLTAKKNQALNSAADAYFNTPADAAYGQGIKLIGTMVNQAKETKEKKRAQEALRQQKDAMLNNMIAEEKRLLTGIRTDLFSKFKDGNLPLSSANISENTIYYFTYAYDPAQLGLKNPTLFLSNVFEVNKYSDGTWPFKTSITSAINKLTPYQEILHGFYKSKEEAMSMQAAMQNVFTKTGGLISPITYKSKTTTSSAASNTDFWESGKKNKDATTNDKKNIKKDDFWNN